ncbi:hypothetical protein ACQFX9_25600 [Aliinostoc sp. HNIBRCY26]|uniref:hypothetical protein n=1 Tax=Aliinostoc sp. HNIBRCY26 TaxID=3418997 RepID=UPI003D075310
MLLAVARRLAGAELGNQFYLVPNPQSPVPSPQSPIPLSVIISSCLDNTISDRVPLTALITQHSALLTSGLSHNF